MCLTIPKKVILIGDNNVTVEDPNGDRQILGSIVELEIGDYCLSQQGVIIEKIDKNQAKEVLKFLKEGKV
jgi:hydrogenase assembly chaperone HypC/HupF